MKTLVDLLNHYYMRLRCFHLESTPMLVKNIREARSIREGVDILNEYQKTWLDLKSAGVSEADYPARSALKKNLEKLKKLNLGTIPEPPWDIECFLKSELI